MVVWRSCCRSVFERWTAGLALKGGGPGRSSVALADEPRLNGSIGTVCRRVGDLSGHS